MNGVFIHFFLGLITPFGSMKLLDLFHFYISMILRKTEIFYDCKILRFINCDTNVSSYLLFCSYCSFQLNRCHLQLQINQWLLIFHMINLSSNWSSVIRWNIFSTASESMFKHWKVNKSNYILFWVSGKFLAMLW